MAVLALLCCVDFSLGSGDYFLVAVHRLLIAVASLVWRSLGHGGFSSWGSWALEHRLSSCGTWA